MARDPHDPTSDEYYTKYESIQEELNYYYEANNDVFRDKVIICPCDDPDWSNFTKFFASSNFSHYGLKALICTSYAYGKHEVTEETKNAPQYDPEKEKTHGKLYILRREMLVDGDTPDSIPWEYLEGDGDYASDEVTNLCKEADIIITNPPFSQFVTREDDKPSFIKWCIENNKQFIIIGDIRKSYKSDMFPYILNNQCWIGATSVKVFETLENKEKTFGNITWYTNVEHSKHIHPIENLKTMEENIISNRAFLKEMIRVWKNWKAVPKEDDLTPEEWQQYKEWIKEHGYFKYLNLDAIDIPIISALPSDYPGLMGLPPSALVVGISPKQFKIVGIGSGDLGKKIGVQKNYRGRSDISYMTEAGPKCPFARIFIRYTDEWKESHPELFNSKEKK